MERAEAYNAVMEDMLDRVHEIQDVTYTASDDEVESLIDEIAQIKTARDIVMGLYHRKEET